MRALKLWLTLGAVALGSAATLHGLLLGVGGSIGLPRTDFTSAPGVGTAFHAASRELIVSATPVSTNFGTGTPSAVTAPRQLAIHFLVPDNAGTTVASVVGNDLELVGSLDEDRNGTIDHSGVLLTGEILAMGSLAIPGPTADSLDMRFRVTGGALASKYNGKDIGVVVGMENSTFGGQFQSNFTGSAKGFIGPIACAGRIGDFVWHDLNNNGIQDAGEPGINGVEVTLNGTDSFGNPVSATATTGTGPLNQSGYYQFTNLCAGEYVAAAATPSGFEPTTSLAGTDRATDSNGSPTTVVLTGLSDQTIDFGFRTPCAGVIGDFVWHDLNRNGVQDAGEPGIDGVTVNLIDPATNAAIATTTTGPNGFYKFTGLCPGNYRVQVDETGLPAGLTPTLTSVPPDTAIDSNPNPFMVTLPAYDTEDLTIDFGYVSPCTGSLGDFVWYDKNQNGIQDAGEQGIDGVTVNLMDTSNAVLATTTTGPNGYYQFTGLCAKTYRVAVDGATVPAGFSPTLVGVGGDGAVDSNPNPFEVTLPFDTSSDITIDFGYVAPCTGEIGDYVWHDLNGNGIQEAGEPPIAGVVVNLRGSDNSILQTDATDANGLYLFEGLCPGAYKVEVVTPAGYAPTLTTAPGSTPATDSNPNPTVVTLLFDDSSDLTNDFGFVRLCTGSIGDFVWFDANRNGIQDAGETGIPGMLVTLKDSSDNVIATATTNASGYYLFTNLCAGSYSVVVETPAGYDPTTSSAPGSTTVNDSNGSPAPVTLPFNNSSDLTIDFGFVVEEVICIPVDGSNTPTGTLTWSIQPNGDVLVRYNQSRGINDNSYGANSIGWPGSNHRFAHLVTSDQARFAFKNTAGVVVLDFSMDYISVKAGTPSGYASLGATGGDGALHVGNAAWILETRSSLQENLNDLGLCAGGNCTVAGVNLLVDSPPADANFNVLNPVFSGWNFTNSFIMRISAAAFGTSGFGSVALTEIHNSPAKSGDDRIVPGPCVPDTEPPPPPPACSECDGKVSELTLEYLGTIPNAHVQVFQKDGAKVFDGIVQPGGTFNFSGVDKQDTLGTDITIKLNGAVHASIHTSCSQPIGPGLVAGQFKVVAGQSRNGGDLCPLPSLSQGTPTKPRGKK